MNAVNDYLQTITPQWNVPFITSAETREPKPPYSGEIKDAAHDLHVDIFVSNYLVSDDVAIVNLFVKINNYEEIVEGTSKRDPKDKPDDDLAILLALSRALRKVQKVVEKQALGKVKHNDDIVLLKKSQRKKKEGRVKSVISRRSSKKVG